MKQSIICLFFSFTFTIHAIVIVNGNQTSEPFGFTQNITTSTHDKNTETLFIGLEEGAGNFAISRAVQSYFSDENKCVPIANKTLSNASIEFLSHIQTPNQSLLAAVQKETSPFQANTITFLSHEGSIYTTTEALADASGTNTTGGIVNIANSDTHLIAALKGATGNFGDEGSGIALINIDSTLLSTIIAKIKNAQNGTDENRAQALHANSDVITGGTSAVTFLSGTDENQVSITYNTSLDLFYLGVRIQTAAQDDAIGKAVIIAQVTDTGIVLKEIISNDVLTPQPPAMQNYIIAAQANAAQLKTIHLGSMKTSTGLDYLITNSFNNANQFPGKNNELYALPLVNNKTSQDHGMIANPDPTLFTGIFNKKIESTSQMLTSDSAAALIGGGPLPIEDQTQIKQIEVVQDTVYVGLGNNSDNENNTGIFFSQAQFGPLGNIVNWTQWAKRAVAFNTFPSLNEDPTRINFFHINPTAGTIWIGENNTKKIVGSTSWVDTDTENGLLSNLNAQLQEGCFSVLDLHSATPGFITRDTGIINTPHRYALFGGYEKVIFARISQANENTLPFFPETIITDYTSTENFITTPLPSPSGAVQHLAYSKRQELFKNYFFAGSDNGLFVFSHTNGDGFFASDLQLLNQSPFAGGIWHNIPFFSHPITDLASEGNALYVLTSEFSEQNPFIDRLYVIPYATDQTLGENIDQLFTPENIHLIAETGSGIFANVSSFTGISIVATDQDNNLTVPGNIKTDLREQLLLTTSNGLYKTNASQTNDDNTFFQGSADALSEDDAQWSIVQGSNNIPFITIQSTDSPIHHTSWPLSLADPLGCALFNTGIINQISGSENPNAIPDEILRGQSATIGNFRPNTYISPIATNLIPPITYFWTDGARKFVILHTINDIYQKNRLATLSFNIPTIPFFITHPIIQKQKQFYWIQLIGRQGTLLVGTNNGIISLQ